MYKNYCLGISDANEFKSKLKENVKYCYVDLPEAPMTPAR